MPAPATLPIQRKYSCEDEDLQQGLEIFSWEIQHRILKNIPLFLKVNPHCPFAVYHRSFYTIHFHPDFLLNNVDISSYYLPWNQYLIKV
ncbi:MAG TPA: hypothetical protein PLB12_12390, partial [Candidatus Goldiibacteriota bacterium]|nr:hypothetical protein [Candidatus Goldiibacteriota bacterium]